MAIISSRKTITPYVTKDGSQIFELMHPEQQGNRQQSLAEALVMPGQKTLSHLHKVSEELYHITQGQGLMTLDNETFSITQGDTVCIPPGCSHCIENNGEVDLHILCMCSPPYSHDDTEITEP